jgi:hypothetical protein
MLKRTLVLVAACCALACRLSADTLTATSAGAGGSPETCPPGGAACYAGISANGPSFTLGGDGYALAGFFGTGVIPFLTPISTSLSVSGTAVGMGPEALVGGNFEGTPVNYVGSATVNAPAIEITCPSPATTMGCLTSSTFTITVGGVAVSSFTQSSPETGVTLPATISGTFSACDNTLNPFCTAGPSLGNVAINSPGTLDIAIDVVSFPNIAEVTESFTTTPEPASLLLVALGVALPIAIKLRRKLHN